MVPDQPRPLFVLVAGVPRSGSTWLFNAARLSLQRAGLAPHAAWVADYRPEDPAPVHLVKAHRDAEVAFQPDKILTTRRPTEACLASLIRMGWLSPTPEAIRRSWETHRALQSFWQARSHLEIPYEQIVKAPELALEALGRVLEIELSCADRAEVAQALAALRAPEGDRYDPETLLHPRHRGEGEELLTPEEILRIVTE